MSSHLQPSRYVGNRRRRNAGYSRARSHRKIARRWPSIERETRRRNEQRGYTRVRFRDWTAREEFLDLRQKPLRDIRIDKIPYGFGIDSGRTLDDFLKKLSEPVGDVTFEELYETSGIDLNVTVTNLTKRRVEYFCASETPSASVIDAVRYSCTVPGLFCISKKEGGDVYVDGGLVDNFSMERGRDVTNTGEILGICYENDPRDEGEIKDVRDFLVAVFETITNPPKEFRTTQSERILSIQSESITLDFGANVERRISWFSQGAERASEFLKKIA
jgi:predicted acylesterase/phospholipase RssA